MALTNSLAILYSDKVLLQLEKDLVFGSQLICNRDYEADVQGHFKSVKLTGVYDPIVSTYTPNSDMTPDTLTDFQTTLTIDQKDSYFFDVDDTEDVQAVPKLTPQALVRAAYKMADKADKYVAAQLSAAIGATALDTNWTSTAAIGSSSAPSAISVAAFSDPVSNSAMYEYLVDLAADLDAVGVPRSDRYVTLPPWAVADLNKDLRFTGYPGYDSGNTVLTSGFAASVGQSGLAGSVSGLNVIQSLNVPTGTFTTPTTSNPYKNTAGTSQTYYQIVAGVPEATTFANQILLHESFRDPRRIAWSHRGLHLYGLKVVWPERLVGAYIAQGS